MTLASQGDNQWGDKTQGNELTEINTNLREINTNLTEIKAILSDFLTQYHNYEAKK